MISVDFFFSSYVYIPMNLGTYGKFKFREIAKLLFSFFVSPIFVVACLFSGLQSCWWVESPISVVVCIPLMTKDVEHLFVCLLDILCIFFREMFTEILCSWTIFLLEFFIYSEYQSFIDMICKYLHPFCVSFTHFLNSGLTKDFNFDEV